ncbi:hypothetical protein [Nitrosomonas sp.]|uniref:hypothetical protein n=1 Tax=Nitrosomonas sp. TaxID=42353 RepID=UPI0025F67DC0|nr:hypothetical protein [Nitrosomonas sp.]MBY0485148.1 hypothetical protein [Nitrosomonas sp.]
MHNRLHIKNIRLIHLIIALLAMIESHSVLARDGHGGGGHFGGNYGHSGGYSSHGHSHLNLGINLGGYYGPGFYGYGGYGGYSRYGFGGYGFGGYGYGYPSYYPPYYAYPPTVIVPSTPPVYTQQQQAEPVQPQTDYWYYCQNPDGYYPYVKNCPGGWLQVAPQPPAQ